MAANDVRGLVSIWLYHATHDVQCNDHSRPRRAPCARMCETLRSAHLQPSAGLLNQRPTKVGGGHPRLRQRRKQVSAAYGVPAARRPPARVRVKSSAETTRDMCPLRGREV